MFYLTGNIRKRGKFWAIEVPFIPIYTQGDSKKDAFRMMKLAIEELAKEKNFFTIKYIKYGKFIIKSNPKNNKLVLFILRRLVNKMFTKCSWK
jgi:predicted RNase H-like HicB family nuclease